MAKRKGPQMAHSTEEELAREFDALIDKAAEEVGDEELETRVKDASAVADSARERASRRERA